MKDLPKDKMQWRVNTPGMLEEVLKNKGTWVLKIPFTILQHVLAEVAARAIELDDKELNKLMLRLSLYEMANPKSPDFDLGKVQKYLES